MLAQLGLVTAQTAVTINAGSVLSQQIDGFGVSQAFGRAAQFRDDFPPGPRQLALDFLFSTTTGAGFSIVRNRIGSGTWSGDSILPTNPGGPNASPTYVWSNDDRGQVWFSQQAARYGVTTFYANAWSAPGFMKTNGQEISGGWLCGVTGRSCSSGDWRQAYANFLVRYIRYYEEQVGIRYTHLGFLNEPDWVVSYSSMQSNAAEAASFIPILYNTLQSAGLGRINITCCDALGWPSARTITNGLVSAGMEQYLGVMTSHMYSGDPNTPLSTRLRVWQTEAADLDSSWCTTWYSNGGLCEGLTWANKIATGILNANLSAYLYWQGAQINQFQAASYLVATDGTTVYPSGRLWAFAQWSRFVRPGANRLSTSGSITGVLWGAFKNSDGSVVAVFTNSGSGAQSARVSLSGFTAGAASAWVTDNTRSVAGLTVSLSGGVATVSLPARSVVTVKLTPGTAVPPPTTPPSSTPTSSPPGGCTAAQFAQCGGIGYSGCTTCASGLRCVYSNDWYSQCL
ncbi:glycoside hydrolase superfamily [Plectosphaerella cucumerina]|uniref:Glycoside hydrolase superfamily n=1 Tax=Plectosphaerella cucumerina TaxID=40658 RepID=A0A8K0TMI7_9PEZI|nr:glycoside hydrolase superfamily [Plectosphaerella cucumerina]